MLIKNNAGRAMYLSEPKPVCLSFAKTWLKRSGKTGMPTREEWTNNRGMFTIEAVEELFGSYDLMIVELEKAMKAPMEPKPKRKLYTDKELAEILYRVCMEKGSYFTGAEYTAWRSGRSTDFPVVTTIAKRLGEGLWSQAIFDRMWQLLELEPHLFEKASESTQVVRKTEFTSKFLNLGDGIKLKSYRLVNLLSYDYQLNCEGRCIMVPEDYPSVTIKEDKTIKAISPGKSEKNSKFKLILEQDGHKIELPDPTPDVVYLIDSSLYESIPADQRRSDLLPVYQPDYFEPSPLGLHALAL